jgi:hypothetical protein
MSILSGSGPPESHRDERLTLRGGWEMSAGADTSSGVVFDAAEIDVEVTTARR